MSKLRISLSTIKPFGRQLRAQARTYYSCIVSKHFKGIDARRCSRATGGHFNLHRACKLSVTGMLYAGLVALTGCATSAELEYLRAEVAKANAVASRAEASVSQAQRELAEMKKASASSGPPSVPSSPCKPTQRRCQRDYLNR